jgi:hypothetical protein
LTEEWFMLFWLAILCNIIVLGLIKGWFILFLLYCLPLLLKGWQRRGSCCCCYIVYHYWLRFDRGVIHVVVVVILSTITVWGLTEDWFMLFLYCISLLFKVWQRSCSCYCYYIVYHYCLRFDRGEVHVVVVILSTITV